MGGGGGGILLATGAAVMMDPSVRASCEGAGRRERRDHRQSLFQGRGSAIAPDHDGQGPGVRVAAPGRRAAGRRTREREWNAAECIRVRLEGRGECFGGAASAEPVTLTQNECEYEPHVLGIMAGQPLRVVSNDPTTHNIHIMPKAGHDFDVTQQPGSPPVTDKFSTPQIMVPVHCNIHNWMQAYIGVVTNPYYAVTGDGGSFTIKGVPAGNYTLSIWTATFGTQEREVTVRAGETASVDFTFGGR